MDFWTIFALATPLGRSGIAVVRVSGPEARTAVEGLVGALPRVGRSLRRIVGKRGEIDQALVLTFAAGASFTGEDVVELHLHGSQAVVAAVLAELGGLPRLRPADAGEFTRRALHNRRLDLAQVEGLADLIDAETEAQRVQALRVFRGALGAKVDVWRGICVRAMALMEATIDFVEDEVPVDVWPEVSALLSELQHGIEDEVRGASVAERIRTGFEVAIVGEVNIGKSTLLNRLAGREAAITSTVAGTTRDVIEVRMDVDGLPVTLLDTAGLREAVDEVEKIGISKGIDRARAADIRVHLTQAGSKPLSDVGADDLVVVGQDDDGMFENGVSGLSGFGVDRLVRAIGERLAKRSALAGIAIRERHRLAMVNALDGLSGIADVELVELKAEMLRAAVRDLDSIVGRVDVEDLLDEIFSSFCIGK